MRAQQVEKALQRQNQRHESELPEFDADVEGEQRQRHVLLRQPGVGQRGGEAEAVQQPEGEGDDPGMPDGEARLAAPGANDLRPEKQNAQGDRGLERQPRDLGIAERGHGQRDAVRNGEGGDRLDQHPAVADDQQQPEHEQQVVGAEQDVPDALDDVGADHFPARLRGGDLEPGLRRAHDGLQRRSIQQLDADQGIGDRVLQARQCRCARRRARSDRRRSSAARQASR